MEPADAEIFFQKRIGPVENADRVFADDDDFLAGRIGLDVESVIAFGFFEFAEDFFRNQGLSVLQCGEKDFSVVRGAFVHPEENRRGGRPLDILRPCDFSEIALQFGNSPHFGTARFCIEMNQSIGFSVDCQRILRGMAP
ncbi:hypothetical protein SDC9_208465 [bioreactor metagenome]|uniref:Uncharacterized protein n=1 Tax=bioreactor metagenome TaxID=1076179 RepID=A0A645JK82_9ZZZZ